MDLTQEHYNILSDAALIDEQEALEFFTGEKRAVFGTIRDSEDPTSVEEICNEFDAVFQTFDPPVDRDHFESRYVLARDVEDADAVQKHLKFGELHEIGELLGYPSCCIEEYPVRGSADAAIPGKLAGVTPYPYYTNRFLRMNRNRCLLSHFPCSFACEHSIEQAKTRLSLLEEYDPSAATDIKKHLQSFVVYIHEQGVVYAPEYTRTGDEVTAPEFLSGRGGTPADIVDQFNDAGTLTVNSANSVTVGETTFSGDDIGVAFFEDPST